MSASSHAQRERHELADLMDALGPDAPTLCTGWTTRDLAAHLVVREARPDAAVGIVFAPMAGWTARVQDEEATQPYPAIVEKVRSGPPTLSPFSLPGADGLANLVEYVVHHEDVIRAQPEWQPRDLPADLANTLWQRLRVTARGRFRRSAVGVTLARTDRPDTAVVKSGSPMVTVRGTALELLMLSFGRRAVRVELDGEAAAVSAFRARYLTG